MAENRWRGKLGKQAIVMIAATFLIGSLAASVRIGMASPALRAAPSAPALLTPKQRELAERIIASTKKRMEAFRCTHVKLESRFVEEEGAKRIISPMPAQMEAWWDSWTSRYRVQYTPRVVRWLHGASDFSISDETTVFDGRSVYNWKEGRPMTENPVSPDRLLHPDYLNLHDGSYLIQMLSMVLHYGSLQPGVVEYAITETQWEGEEAVKIVETFTSDDKIQQQRTIVVTAGENDLIRFSETLFPHGNFTRKTINQVAKAANGEFYATHYTTASSIRKTITTTQYTVLSLEPLAELPAAVFHLPTTRPVTAISEKPYVQPEAIALQCLESETGMPIPDVKLRVVINKKKSTLVTDREGRATLSLPGEEITYLTVQTRKAGHAPRLLRWYKEADPLQIPATYSIKLPKGSPIFGSVVNEAGEGIAGASVRFHLSGTSQIWGAFMDGYDLTGKLATTETDAEGRWRLADFPLELKNLFFRISAPGYQATTDSGIGDFRNSTGLPYTALRDGTAVVTLQRGHQLHGTITDRKGQPIADCRVVLGRDIHGSNPPTTRTNAAGEYVLQGLRSESTWITVESPLHQPVAKEITLPIVGTLDFALEPGRVIRGRVTLPDGKPSAGLNVHVDGWNQLRTLDFSTKTDAEGRFIWRGAPKEPVGFVFGTGQSREFLSDLPLSASDKVQTVVIKPALRFKGKVFDDETGKPIQRFILLHGDATYGNATWNHESSQTCKEGQFDWSTTRFGRRYMFRFEAPGYEPFVSGPLESRQNVETATIRLKRQ